MRSLILLQFSIEYRTHIKNSHIEGNLKNKKWPFLPILGWAQSKLLAHFGSQKFIKIEILEVLQYTVSFLRTAPQVRKIPVLPNPIKKTPPVYCHLLSQRWILFLSALYDLRFRLQLPLNQGTGR